MREKLRFLGMDVHAETIAVAIAEPDGEVRSLGTIANREDSILTGHYISLPVRRSYDRSAPRSNRDLTISVQRTTWKVRFQRVSGKKCTRTWPIHASL